MGLVHDDGVILAGMLHLLVNDGEFLDGRDDDASPFIQGVTELCGVFVNLHHQAFLVVELVHGILQLAVQNTPVRDDDDSLENLVVAGVMQAGKAVRQPSYGIGLAAARAVLDEVVMA